jgi:hypothetical protein
VNGGLSSSEVKLARGKWGQPASDTVEVLFGAAYLIQDGVKRTIKAVGISKRA